MTLYSSPLQAPCAVVALVCSLRPVRVVPVGLLVLAAAVAYAAGVAVASERCARRTHGPSWEQCLWVVQPMGPK